MGRDGVRDCLVNGWMKTGLYPINPEMVLREFRNRDLGVDALKNDETNQKWAESLKLFTETLRDVAAKTTKKLELRGEAIFDGAPAIPDAEDGDDPIFVPKQHRGQVFTFVSGKVALPDDYEEWLGRNGQKLEKCIEKGKAIQAEKAEKEKKMKEAKKGKKGKISKEEAMAREADFLDEIDEATSAYPPFHDDYNNSPRTMLLPLELSMTPAKVLTERDFELVDVIPKKSSLVENG